MFLQAEIDGLRVEEFEQRYGIGRNGREAIREGLKEKFAGEVAARGLWLATVEAVRQGVVDTRELQPRPKGPLTGSEESILEMMYRGATSFEIAQKAKIERRRRVSLIIDVIVRKVGFENPVQLLAWMASEEQKARKL